MDTAFGEEEIFVALRQAIRAREAVPAEFVTAAKSAFAWHNIDAELAQLTYDSSRDLAGAASTRTEAATIRALTFTSARLTIELEVTQDSLLGQVVPAQAATITVQPRAGETTEVRADDIGCFSIQPTPTGSFRLQCSTDAGIEILTGWFTL